MLGAGEKATVPTRMAGDLHERTGLRLSTSYAKSSTMTLQHHRFSSLPRALEDVLSPLQDQAKSLVGSKAEHNRPEPQLCQPGSLPMLAHFGTSFSQTRSCLK